MFSQKKLKKSIQRARPRVMHSYNYTKSR